MGFGGKMVLFVAFAWILIIFTRVKGVGFFSKGAK